MARKSSLDGRRNRAPSAPYTGPAPPVTRTGRTYRDGRSLASIVTGVDAHRACSRFLFRHLLRGSACTCIPVPGCSDFRELSCLISYASVGL